LDSERIEMDPKSAKSKSLRLPIIIIIIERAKNNGG
jgi:hypothetical protein